MNSRQIEIKLERYFNGESSLEDEKILREFFQQENIPPHLISLKAQFEYFTKEQNHEYLGNDFDNKILDLIADQERNQKRNLRRRYLYTASGIAASIVIILSIFFQVDPFSKKVGDTFSNPYDAYLETKKALMFVSEAFNKGAEPLQEVGKFDEGMQEMEKISSFNTGLNEVRKISKFNETKEKILYN